MLQIILTPNDKYSLAESAQMAVEAGAMWLQLSLPDMSDEMIREEVRDIVTLCRESGVILTIEDRPDMARELGLHGVFLHTGKASPVSVREELGPEAIIGTEIGSADAALSMARADIDYVAMSPETQNCAPVIADIRSAGCEIPVVAYAPRTSLFDEETDAVMAQGFSGICGGARIFAEDGDPVVKIESVLRHLS